MINHHILISGNEYNLPELFDMDIVISIPDMQRDYCWGVQNLGSSGKEQGELVSAFLDSIKKEAADHENEMSSSTGLIYAYEWPKGTYQLCDGQQRITTLFLLAGILYRLEEDDDVELRNILYRENQIKKGFASLQYGIRETSIHFLDDFVKKYFLERAPELHWRNKEQRESKGALQSKDRPSWYYHEYDFDPTIQSLLCATKIIEDELSELSSDNLSDIKDFILHRMTFIFYDLENRTKGEETFVVINNTGEPLSSSENLKPQLVGLVSDNVQRIAYVKQWETREDFFWHNRNIKTEFTSDDFSKDFYNWHFLLKYGHVLDRDLRKSVDSSELDDIDKTFKAFTKFYEYCIGKNAAFITDDGIPIFEKVKDWDESNESLLFWLRQDDRKALLLPILEYIKKFRLNNSFTTVDNLFLRKLLRVYISLSYGLNGDKTKWSSLVEIVQTSELPEDVVAQLPGNTIVGDSTFNDVELFKYELDPSIRMNTDILFSELATPESVRNRYANLKYLCLLGNAEFAKEHIDDSNLYRVLRVFHNWGGKIEHQYNTSWDYYGRYINNLYEPKFWYEYKLKYDTIYSSSLFKNLLDTPHENISTAIRSMVKEYISQHPQLLNLSLERYTPSSFLKSWMYAKMLCVIDTGKLLSLYNGLPFGGFRQDYPQGNMINPNVPLSLVNCVARRFWKGGYDHVNNEHYNIVNFDSPLFTSNTLDFAQWDTHNDNRFNISPETFDMVMNHILEKHNEFVGSEDL